MPRLEPRFEHHDPGPDPHAGDDCGPYERWAIADDLGFATLGLSVERIPPGSRTSLRHWHAAEDEAVCVLSGDLVLVEAVETALGPGDIAAWRAGDETAHCLENRSERDAVILVTGARGRPDVVTYPEHDLVLHRSAAGERFTRRDGTPVANAAR